MSFEKWKKKNSGFPSYANCWDAAQAEMREQCAKVCEAFGKTLDEERQFFGDVFAEEVRALD